MRNIVATLAAVSSSDLLVMITGEKGTGKNLIARSVHEMSPRRRQPFVVFDCRSAENGLRKNVLLGDLQRADGPRSNLPTGCFERAEGGTLILAEIDALEGSLQQALAERLQRTRVSPALGQRKSDANVRILATSVRNLRAMVRQGTFCRDLYSHLSILRLHIPPLRERKEDLPLLVDHLLSQVMRRHRISLRIRPSAMRALIEYDWPGNLDELRAVIDRIGRLRDGSTVTPSDIFADDYAWLPPLEPALGG